MNIKSSFTPVGRIDYTYEQMKSAHGVYRLINESAHDGDIVISSPLGIFYVNLKSDSQPKLAKGHFFEKDCRYSITDKEITLTFSNH